MSLARGAGSRDDPPRAALATTAAHTGGRRRRIPRGALGLARKPGKKGRRNLPAAFLVCAQVSGVPEELMRGVGEILCRNPPATLAEFVEAMVATRRACASLRLG